MVLSAHYFGPDFQSGRRTLSCKNERVLPNLEESCGSRTQNKLFICYGLGCLFDNFLIDKLFCYYYRRSCDLDCLRFPFLLLSVRQLSLHFHD